MNNHSQQELTPDYFITYCVMDSSAGANPLGHAFLILSQRLDDGQIKVVNTLGYYSQPTSTTHPVVKAIKDVLDVRYNLQDGHGQFRHEKMREINHQGIYGISFPLSQEQFLFHNQDFNDIIVLQEKTIAELNEQLTKENQNAWERWALEQKLHPKQDDQRLQKFHLELNFSWFGPDCLKSYTCKDRALDYLHQHGIITPEFKKEFRNTWHGLSPFPVFSGVNVYPIRLQSSGELHKQISKGTKKEFYNACFDFDVEPIEDQKSPPANQLFWVFPPVLANNKGELMSKEHIQLKLPEASIKVLERIKTLQGNLYKQLAKNPDDAKLLYLKASLEDKIVSFNQPAKNIKADELNPLIQKTEKLLNIISLTLEPQRLDQSFLLRVYYDLHIRQALKSLAVLGLSLAYLAAAPGLGMAIPMITYCCYAIAAISLYSAISQSMQFFKTENHFQEMKHDFQEFKLAAV